MEYVLYHHGIKGQRWGIRRYQNPDGSLTAAGRKRYENEDGSLNDAGRKFYAEQDRARRAAASGGQSASRTTLANRMMNEEMREAQTRKKWDESNPSPTKRAANAASESASALNKLADLERKHRPAPKVMKLDLSNKSDQEMRNEINRALLERQYNDLFAPKKVNKGREVMGKILEYSGVALDLTGSALSVANQIQELMG